ncbi:hypothetical protein RIF29_00841 [Crotalaria pallida]|uniref:RRM domain-containing protein n=1 Tax=Crotalaria pallida TaxID=3830 RepID=A0AAN9IW67_CROPI
MASIPLSILLLQIKATMRLWLCCFTMELMSILEIIVVSPLDVEIVALLGIIVVKWMRFQISSLKVQTGLSEGYGFVEFFSHSTTEKVLQNYAGILMPNTDQPFRLNWATFST